MVPRTVVGLLLALPVFLLSVVGLGAAQGLDRGPENAGLAWTSTTPDVPLLFTAQVLGRSETTGFSSDPREQAERVMANLESLLVAQGANLSQVIKVNFYLTDDGLYEAAVAALNARFSGNPVPASFVRTRLTEPGALLALDAVVRLPPGAEEKRASYPVGFRPKLAGAAGAVLPAGRKVFLSGLVGRKNSVRESVRETLESQGRIMRHFDLSPADVVHVKAWVAPLDALSEVNEEFGRFFGEGKVPAIALIEWTSANATEIEFVLAGANADPACFSGPVAFGTRPGATPPTVFSHVAFVEAGQPLIFTAGLYGRPGDPAREQLQDVFSQLGRLLFDAESSFRHLVKAVYHSADTESRRMLRDIREVYYDPARPPAASGVMVPGTGRAGRLITLDMIAVPRPAEVRSP